MQEMPLQVVRLQSNVTEAVQNIISEFNSIFTLDEEDQLPSSFWNEKMAMLVDEDLPLGMRVYSHWNQYRERFSKGGWLWHAPARVFRLPHENQFLLAQCNEKWLVYDCHDGKIKKLLDGKLNKTYDSLMDVF